MVALVQLAPGTVGFAGPGRVLPAATVQLLIDAEQVLTEARREADALVGAARESADAVRAEATETGLAAARSELQDRLMEIAAASVHVMARNEQRIVDMGIQIARRIIGTIDPTQVATQIVLRGLKFAGQSSLIRLRVAPASVETIRDRLEDIVPGTVSRAVVEVIGDPRVRDAGCILETDAGLIDATIESQIAAIERGLRGSLASHMTKVA